MAHTYLNPDKDGDTDHLIAINMSGSGLARSALYAIESKSSGAVQGYYLNSFADKSILDMQVFGEDASKYTSCFLIQMIMIIGQMRSVLERLLS